MKKFFSNPIVRFLSFGLFLYILWFALYEWWIHPAQWIDKIIVNNTLSSSQKFLELLGFSVVRRGERFLSIAGTPGLLIGDPCNGISLFALFSIFIIAFPGKWKIKLIFIPLGILLIHLLNVIRVTVLAVIQIYSYEWTEFNHTYTFTVLIYIFIFAMWILWVNKFSGINKENK